MKSLSYKNAPANENPHGVDVKKLYDMPEVQVLHITLQPGERLKPHKTPVDVVFYILEGEPTIHINGESISQVKDTLIESPAKIPHFISNESKETARILVIKAPRPENKSKLL